MYKSISDKNKYTGMHKHLTAKHIRLFCIILFVVGIVGFAGYRSFGLLKGAEVSIANITDGSTSDGVVTVSGTTKHASSININGRQIILDETGSFTDTLLLPPGASTVTVSAKDTLSRTNNTLFHLYRHPDAFGMKTLPRASSDTITNYQ